MNAPEPPTDAATYVAAVLVLYVELPDTPLRASIQDQRQARRLHDRGIPLRLVESALLLASLRRLVRPADVPDPLVGLLPAGHRGTAGPPPPRQLPGIPAAQTTPSGRRADRPGRCSEKYVS